MTGFTLQEAMITTLMLGMLMTMMAAMVTGYARVFDQSSKKDRTVVAMSAALTALRAEVAEAISVADPAGGTSSQLQLLKVTPANPARLTGAGPNWRPYDSNGAAPDDYLVNVTYHVQNEGLWRTVLFPGGGTETHLLVDGVTGFACTDLGDSSLEAVASLQERNRTRTLRIRALRRVR